MATGDVRGNLERLKLQLRSISYPHPLDSQGCKDGLPAAILPLVHYALLGYSRHVARYLNVNGYILYAKSDLRFVECVIKLLRKEFEYRCPLTVAQVFARGFAEKKFLFVHDLIQMCKRKHNDLLRVVRNAEKMTRVCQPKAFGTALRTQQKPNYTRNKHLSSKFDRRCELDLLPDAKCLEICRRSAFQENSWVPLEEGRTRLNAVDDDVEESIRAESSERAKNHGLKILARSSDHNVDEKCRLMHPSMLSSKSFPRTHVVMGAQMIHKERRYGSLSPEPLLRERHYDPEASSPRSSCPGLDCPKQGNKYGDDCTLECPASWPSQEDSAALSRDITKTEFTKDGYFKSPPNPPNLDHNSASLEEPVTSKNSEDQLHTPHTQPVPKPQMTTCPSQEGCPHEHLNENRSSASEDAGLPKVPAHVTADGPPQAVWQKIIDLAGKIDSCFCSLDNKIAHSFNSLDDKLETKFKYLDEGVTCTRETLQDKLNVLENRIDHLERTSQISPMSFQTSVTYNDGHPIRDITNTFNNSIDNGSWYANHTKHAHVCRPIEGKHSRFHFKCESTISSNKRDAQSEW